ADPDDAGVLRVEDDVADGVRAFVVENRHPGSAGVGGLPDAARGGGGVVVGAVAGVDGERDDAARGERRAEGTQLEPVQGGGRRGLGGLGFRFLRLVGQRNGQQQG